MKKINLALLLLLFSISSFAQDKIHKRDKTVIDCIITEIGIEEIKYYLSKEEMRNSPMISIAVSEVAKVVLSSGREIEFKDPLNDPSLYTENKQHALKLHFLSPLVEHLAFAYEKSIKPGRSFEAELGIIGLGFDTDPYNTSTGFYASSGYKFIRTPDFYSSRMKYSHILKGSYIKPQLLFSVYQNEQDNFNFLSGRDETNDRNIIAGALLLNFGKQIVYDNAFLIDYSVGIGYGFSNQGNSDANDFFDFRASHFGFVAGDNDTPIAASARLKIGFLLK